MAAKKGARPRKARGPSPAPPSRARASAEADPIPREVMGLGLVSALGLAIHTYAAGVVGFGDSEALYATYAQHPQLGYLDHPGLVGAVAGIIGHGTLPRPADAHDLTSLVGALVPPLVAATASIAGATSSFTPRIARAFKTDEATAMRDGGLSDEERNMLRQRDWQALIRYGASFFMLEKLAAVVGTSNLHVYAAMRGMSLDGFMQTRKAPGALYSVAGKDSQKLHWDHKADTTRP